MEKSDQIKEKPLAPTEEPAPEASETGELNDKNLDEVSGGLNPQPLPPSHDPHERQRQ